MEKINAPFVDPLHIDGNFIEKIGKQWMLVTAGNPDGFNTMTASWGGIGELWGRPVAFVFIRPQRYTFELAEAHESFSLSFFGKGFRKELALCGSVSGRDRDKVSEAGLTPVAAGSSVAFAQAELVLECRKLYGQFLTEGSFADPTIAEKHYPERDFHKMYVGEIISAWQK
ncbi:MAG: flavin reductase [Alistipes sp.]|nr:flavin reductase [Alistipes sp.]